MKTNTDLISRGSQLICMPRKLSVLLVALLWPLFAFAQNNITVTGTVLDEQDMPVISATVIVLGQANKGAITDLDGHFTIKDVPSTATLRISYVGYKTQDITLTGGGDLTKDQTRTRL